MWAYLQHKTVYKKIVYTRNVTLNLTDLFNITDSPLNENFTRVQHTIQVNLNQDIILLFTRIKPYA